MICSFIQRFGFMGLACLSESHLTAVSSLLTLGHAGTSFRIAVQTEQTTALPDEKWAFFEDPTAAAIAAAQAPPARLSQAKPTTASQPQPHHSNSAADNGQLGSHQSPYAPHQQDVQQSTEQQGNTASPDNPVNKLPHPKAQGTFISSQTGKMGMQASVL